MAYIGNITHMYDMVHVWHTYIGNIIHMYDTAHVYAYCT